jgi:hypothetical protein
MEPLGSHYAILLHNPQLRQTLVHEAPRASAENLRRDTGPAGRPSRTFRWLRVRLAHTLVGLAARIEPSVPVWSTTSRGEAVPGH